MQTQIRSADGTLCPHAGPITLAPGEIMPVVKHYPLLPGVSLTMSAARILGVATQGATTTLVIYGTPGERAEMHFGVPASGVRILQSPCGPGASLTQPAAGRVTLTAAFPPEGPDVFTFRVGARTVRVLAESARPGRPDLVRAGQRPDARSSSARPTSARRTCRAGGWC